MGRKSGKKKDGLVSHFSSPSSTLGINFDNVKLYNNLGQALKAFGIVRK